MVTQPFRRGTTDPLLGEEGYEAAFKPQALFRLIHAKATICEILSEQAAHSYLHIRRGCAHRLEPLRESSVIGIVPPHEGRTEVLSEDTSILVAVEGCDAAIVHANAALKVPIRGVGPHPHNPRNMLSIRCHRLPSLIEEVDAVRERGSLIEGPSVYEETFS